LFVGYARRLELVERIMMRKWILMFLFMQSSVLVAAELRLPSLISDNMVLLRSNATRIWGWAKPGRKIQVTVGSVTGQTVCGDDGAWDVLLDVTSLAEGPFELVVTSEKRVVVKNVLIGEVWLGSGQSNMDKPLGRKSGQTPCLGWQAAVKRSEGRKIRFFRAKRLRAWAEADRLEGKWVEAGEKTTAAFSAVGYYFCENLNDALKQPVGFVDASFPGSRLIAWLPRARLRRFYPKAMAELDQNVEAKTAFVQWTKNHQAAVARYYPVRVKPGFGLTDDGWITKSHGVPFQVPRGTTWFRVRVPVPEEMSDQSFRLSGKLKNCAFHVFSNDRGLTWNGYGTWRQVNPSSLVCRVPPAKGDDQTVDITFRLMAALPDAEVTALTLTAGKTTIDLPMQWERKAEKVYPPLVGKVKLPQSFQPLTSHAVHYNAMIHPLRHLSVRGLLWYQGESEALTHSSDHYVRDFSAMIQDWRERFGNPHLPVYFCQLPEFGPQNRKPLAHNSWGEVRNAQLKVLRTVADTGMAVLAGLGETLEIHPRQKEPVGRRLAALALDKTYGVARGTYPPVFQSAQWESGRVHLHFEHATGLTALKPAQFMAVRAGRDDAKLVVCQPNSPLQGFAICGPQKKWVWADARIDGDTVCVTSPSVKNPVGVRYCYGNTVAGNLSNASGMRAAAFSTWCKESSK
jgi:sialate O-acetylesterase